PELATASYARACTAGSAEGCDELGRRLLEGVGAAVDREAALRASRRGCDGGRAASCRRAASLVEADDAAAALRLHERACDGGEAGSCVDLGVALSRGEGTAADPARAAELFERACDAGDATGCFDLG